MIDRRNSRLNIILTTWFLTVAIIPSLFVTYFSYTLQKKQLVMATERELAIVTRLKIDRFNSYAIYRIQELHNLVSLAIAGGADEDRVLESIEAMIDQQTDQTKPPLYITDNDGAIIHPAGAVGSDAQWLASEDHATPHLRVVNNTMVFAYPVPGTTDWIVSEQGSGILQGLLHEDINDTKYFSRSELFGADYDVGRTADLFILNENGELLSDTLLYGENLGPRIISQPLAAWIARGRDTAITTRTALADHDVLLHARRIQILGQKMAFVTTIDYGEILNQLYDRQRDFILIFIFATISLLILLYVFVRTTTHRLIKPIDSAISDLVNSSAKIQKSIAATEKTMGVQQKVAKSLAKNYQGQLQDINGVETSITEIVKSLADISSQTKATAKNVQLIDQLSLQGRRQAQDATESISSIKRLATAHDVLFESLKHYSAQVDAIAADVRRLSDAMKYLSLNATIETSRSGGSMHSLSSLVSEVGKLALLSKNATVRINELVDSIQTQLQKSKESSVHERSEAETSLATIHKALDSLTTMTRETMKISSSVKVIDKEITSQSENTVVIANHATDLSRQAKNILRDATKINALAAEQNEGVHASTTAVKKLVGIIQQLRELIGARSK